MPHLHSNGVAVRVRAQISKMYCIDQFFADGVSPAQRNRLVVENVVGGEPCAIARYCISGPGWRSGVIRPVEGITAKDLVLFVQRVVDAHI